LTFYSLLRVFDIACQLSKMPAYIYRNVGFRNEEEAKIYS